MTCTHSIDAGEGRRIMKRSRWITLCLGMLAVGCGGGGTAPQAAHPLFDALVPFTTLPVGTRLLYDVERVRTGSDPTPNVRMEQREFEVGVIVDPTGPDVWTLHQTNGSVEDGPDRNSIGVRRTAVGWEVVFFEGATVTAGSVVGVPFDIDVIVPGAVFASAAMTPGDTFQNNVLGTVAAYELTWVGPEAIPGHPDAQRFDAVATISVGRTFPPSDAQRVTATFHMVADRGLVSATIVHVVFNGGVEVGRTAYTVTLAS